MHIQKTRIGRIEVIRACITRTLVILSPDIKRAPARVKGKPGAKQKEPLLLKRVVER